MIDADDHHVPLAAQVERVTSRLHLVEHRLDTAGSATLRNPCLHAALHEARCRAAASATVVGVLANDDRVEVVGRDPAQLDDVLVPAVAGGGHHPDPPSGDQRPPSSCRRLGQEIDELAKGSHRWRVVGIVHDHPVAIQLEHVEAPRRHEVAGAEGAQPLADVVQVRAGRPGCPGRGQGVLDVHSGTPLERGRQEVGPDERHALAPVLEHDHLPVVARLNGHRATATGGLAADHLVARIHAEVDDRP